MSRLIFVAADRPGPDWPVVRERPAGHKRPPWIPGAFSIVQAILQLIYGLDHRLAQSKGKTRLNLAG
jgi:hypothetical protein